MVEPTHPKNISEIGWFPQVGMKMGTNRKIIIFKSTFKKGDLLVSRRVLKGWFYSFKSLPFIKREHMPYVVKYIWHLQICMLMTITYGKGSLTYVSSELWGSSTYKNAISQIYKSYAKKNHMNSQIYTMKSYLTKQCCWWRNPVTTWILRSPVK